MYPPKFDYVRAGSIDEAMSLLKDNEEAKLLAGGHSLIPTLKLRLAAPSMLIDISGIDDLKGLNKSNGVIHMGSLTTHAQVEASDDLPAAMTEAAGWIGDPQVRNRGTVGGSIAHADPASDLPTVLTALGATINVAGVDGARSVS
ncbi:MAG: FAD binding domain-containing protein, partial [Chloroflexota bacterium]